MAFVIIKNHYKTDISKTDYRRLLIISYSQNLAFYKHTKIY